MTRINFKEYWKNQSYQEDIDKQFTLVTGSGGMNMVYVILQKENDKDYAQFLQTSNVITKEEYDTLILMINSKDPEDYEVAKSVLYNLNNKNNESN